MRRKLLTFLLGLCGCSALAQNIEVPDMEGILRQSAENDSLELMSLNTFMALVVNNHPIVKQSNLLTNAARERLRLARGAFDPKLTASLSGKHFDSKEYYNFLNTTLKIPTWFPIDPKISFDRNRGKFVNPENAIPGSDRFRQVAAGLSLPVGKGLMIDQRRAAVREAIIFQDINQAERIKMINKTMLSAAKAYWEWYFSYYNLRLVEASLDISEEIFRRVKLDFGFGEAAAVDTVQAGITLQERLVDRLDARIQFQTSGLALSNFLWGEDGLPRELTQNMAPRLEYRFFEPIERIKVDNLLNQALESHPELRKINLKMAQLRVAEQLARENLKPRIDLNYNFINAPIGELGTFERVQIRDNYKFGITFEFPLFLRKERAKLRQTRIKIDRNNFERSQKELEVINDIKASFFALSNTQGMLGNMQQAVDNYQALLKAELFNLEVGESDLFKINFQLNKLLKAWSKLMKMRATVEKARVNLYWAAGVPYLNFPVLNSGN